MTQRAKLTAAGNVRRISFWIATGLASAFLLFALLATYPLLFTNWLPTDAWLAVRPDRSPGDQVHRLHSLALGVISWGMLAGVALQFHASGCARIVVVGFQRTAPPLVLTSTELT